MDDSSLRGGSILMQTAVYNQPHVLLCAAACIRGAFGGLDVAAGGDEDFSRLDGGAGGDGGRARRAGRVSKRSPGALGGVSVGGAPRERVGVGREQAEDLRLRGQPLRGNARGDRGRKARDLRGHLYLERR